MNEKAGKLLNLCNIRACSLNYRCFKASVNYNDSTFLTSSTNKVLTAFETQ